MRRPHYSPFAIRHSQSIIPYHSPFAIRYSLIALTFLFTALSCNRGITPGVLRFSHFWAEPGQRAVLDSVVAEFEKENPDIPVDLIDLSWADGKTKLMINFNAETAPDVIEFGSDWIAEFSASGVLENLTNDPTFQPALTSSPKYAIEPGVWRDSIFAIPWFVDTRVIFVNQEIAQGADPSFTDSIRFKDWNAMYALGDKIQRSGIGRGIGVNGSDAHRLYKKILPQFWSNGGDIFDAAGNPVFASEKNIAALAFYVKQLDAGMMETQKNLDDAFKRGKLGILFSGAWLLKPLAKSEFKWRSVPFPGNDGNEGISFAGGEYLSINSRSKLKPQAAKLIAFLTRPDNELRLAKAFNIFPANSELQQDSFYLNRNQGNVFIEQLAKARMTPVHPQWLEIEAILEDEVSRALYKKATPEAALRSADKRVAQLFVEG